MSAMTNPEYGAESVEPIEPSPEKREWNVFLVTNLLLIPGVEGWADAASDP